MLYDLLTYFLTFVEIVVCALLVAVIMIQKPKSQGMGLAFGAGMGETLFGSQVGNVLTKITVVLSAIFLVNTAVLALMGAGTARKGSSVTSLIKPGPAAPGMPGAGRPSGPAPSEGAPEGTVPPGAIPVPDGIVPPATPSSGGTPADKPAAGGQGPAGPVTIDIPVPAKPAGPATPEGAKPEKPADKPAP